MGFQRYSQQAFEASRQPTLDFDDLSLNLLNGNLSVSGLHFAGYLPTQSESVAADYIRLNVPEATIEGLDFLKLYKKSRVQLETIHFLHPDIQLVKAEKADSLKMNAQESIRASTASLHSLISPYLKAIAFDQLRVDDGNLFITRQGEASPSNQLHAEHVYINLNDFLLDSLSLENTERLFFAKSFEVQLGEYQIITSDSSYLVQSDTLGYSSKDEKIYLKNLRAFPLNSIQATTNVSFTIPQITFTTVDWKEIYFDSLFHVESLIVERPEFHISTRAQSDSLRKSAGFNFKKFISAQLYPLLEKKFRSLTLSNFSLRKGKLLVEQTGDDTLDILEINDMAIKLGGIRLDTSHHNRDSLQSLLPADTLSIDLQQVKFYLPDHQHYMTVRGARLSTSRRQQFLCNVILDSLDVKPGYDSLEQLLLLPPKQKLAYQIHIPQIKFDGIHLEALNQHQAAVLDSIYIRSPDIRIANFGTLSLGKRAAGLTEAMLETQQTEETVKSILYDWSHARLNLSPFIAPGDSLAFLQWLNATKLQLDSGRIQVLRADMQQYVFVPVTTVDTFYTYLSQIKIDHLPDDSLIISNEGRVAVRAEEVDVFVQEGEFVLPGKGGAGGTLRLQKGRVSTLDRKVYLRKVSYWTSPGFPPNTDFWLHHMYIPYVALSDVNLQKLYQEQIAEALNFSAWSPRFTFNYRKSSIERPEISFDFVDLYPQFSSYFDQIDLGLASLNNADLTIRKISQNRVDTLFYTEKLDVELSRFYIDSLTRMSRSRPFYAQKLNLEMQNYRWNFLSEEPDKQLQGMAGKNLHYNSYEEQLDILGLEVLVNTDSDPLLDKLQLRAQKIMADDIDPYRLIKSEILHIGRLIVQQPYFELAERDGRRINAGSTKGKWESLQPDMNQLLSDHLNKIELRFVHLEQGKLNYLKMSDADTLNALKLDSVDFLARNIRVDGNRERHLHNILYADDVDYSVVSGKLLFNQPDKQRIEIDQARLYSRDSRMHLKGVSVKPSSAMKQDKDQTHIEARLRNLEFDGLDLKQAYLYGDLNIQRVLPKDLKLNVYAGKNRDAPDSKSPSMQELLSPFIRSIEVNQVYFTRGEFSFFDKKKGKEIFATQRLAATISGFSLNQELLQRPSTAGGKVFYADDILLNIKDYALKTADGLYRLKADEIDIATARRTIDIVNFQLQPLLSRQESLHRFEHANSRAKLMTDQVSLYGFNFDKLINKSEWHAHGLDINGPVLEIFRDKRLPHDESRRPPLHQKMLFNLDQPIDIEQVNIEDGFISYAERAPDATQDGVITFEDVDVEIRNVSNLPQALQDQQMLEIQMNALVMGEGQLNAFLRFPVDTSALNFSVKGSLGPMELTHFNRILEPSAFVHIKEGSNQDLQFRFAGNAHKTSGSMEFRYDDLSVLMIDKEKGQAGFEEKIGSFLANAFVLKAHNPKSVFLRIGNIASERDPSRAMFHYWWQSILSGVKSSIGLEKSTEKTKDFSRTDGS